MYIYMYLYVQPTYLPENKETGQFSITEYHSSGSFLLIIRLPSTPSPHMRRSGKCSGRGGDMNVHKGGALSFSVG